MARVGGVLLVAIEGKSRDIPPRPALVGEHRADIGRQILQIPLVDKAVELAAFFARLVGGVHMVHQSDKPDAPLGEEAVEVLFRQLHIPGKPGLGLDQQHLKPPFPGVPQQLHKGGPVPVGAGIVLVAVDPVHLIPLFPGIPQQHGFLVVDALGLLPAAFFVLFAQAAVDGRLHGSFSSCFA